MEKVEFQSRQSVEQVEESTDFAPKFDADGLLPCIAQDAASGEVLMMAWMNAEAVMQTLATGREIGRAHV